MKVQVDWTDWSFGPGRHPIAGAVSAGTLACSVTMVGAVTGLLPAGWPIVAGAVLGFCAAVAAIWQAAPTAAVVFRAGCWVGAGAWSSATLLWSDPWSRWPLVTLATGTAVAAVVGTGLARMERREQPKPVKQPPAPLLRDKTAVKWEALLRRITRKEVTVVRVERWEPPTGLTLHVQLPPDGTTVAELRAYEAAIASAANLPEGCGVEVGTSAQGRRWATLRVATRNALAEDKHIPASLAPLSVNDALPIGVRADGTVCSVNLRFACGVLVGQVGSGKSNTLNVLVHQLSRCTDTVVWAIDLSGGGRMPRPWLRPWQAGQAPRPVIDWVANSEQEAVLLCQAAVSIINGRTAAYQQLMADANDDKLPVSPSVPQIVIVVDEFADLPSKVKELLTTISNTGRGAGVRLMTCVLRATGMEIPRQIVVQASERIAMRLSDESEAQYLFDRGWSTRLDVGVATVPGTGWVASGGRSPALFKAWRIDPNRITEVAAAVARLRPALDEVSVRLAGPAYPGRWERTLPLMFPGGGQPAPVRREATAESTVATIVEPTTEQGETVNLDESAKRLEAAREAARRAREEAEARQSEPEPDWSVPEGWLAEASASGPAPSLPPRVRMRQLVQEHRRDGIGPRAVWQTLQSEGHGTAEQTVITWMRADATAGVLAQPGGKGTPYVPGPRFSLEL